MFCLNIKKKPTRVYLVIRFILLSPVLIAYLFFYTIYSIISILKKKELNRIDLNS